jgi:outer membrane protein TolC
LRVPRAHLRLRPFQAPDSLANRHERPAAGKVTDLDVAEAGASLNTAQGDLRAFQLAEGEVKRALELLLGRYPAAEIAVAGAFAPVPPPVRAGLPASLLERRPDMLAAEREVLAAFRLQEASRLALLPGFTLGLEGGQFEDSLLSVLQLQAEQLGTQMAVIKLQDAQLANRIHLHLALGGGFEAGPAAVVAGSLPVWQSSDK